MRVRVSVGVRVGVGCGAGVRARARVRVHRFTCTVKESMTELRSPVIGSRSSAPGHTPEGWRGQGRHASVGGEVGVVRVVAERVALDGGQVVRVVEAEDMPDLVHLVRDGARARVRVRGRGSVHRRRLEVKALPARLKDVVDEHQGHDHQGQHAERW
eukprot:scaffold44240_cov59-Phaeocystis_antarctica.AAC.9